jgi:hypothetical protein
MRFKMLTASLLFSALPVAVVAQVVPDDQVPLTYTQNATPRTGRLGAAGGGGVIGNRSNGGVLGIDTVPNWSSYFYLPGLVPTAFGAFPQWTWQYGMVGHSPFTKGQETDWVGYTTWIGAPIIPVIIDLRNFDGSPRFLNGVRLILDPTAYVSRLLKSPVFSNSFYDSSQNPTQFTDAVQRAEFFNKATRDQVFTSVLFPPTPDDTSTVIGAAENSGDFRPRDIGTFFFANTFLFSSVDGSCCVLGFHSYDTEPGTALNGWREKHYVMNYASWISPGLFGGGFQDITAVSHEMAELFNDPFMNNATPIWLAPNGLCQNNLETGDVIEGLPNAVTAISLNGSVYHPQNEALLQWFASETPSSAIHSAYSYPDTTVLGSASVSMAPGCTGPANVQ